MVLCSTCKQISPLSKLQSTNDGDPSEGYLHSQLGKLQISAMEGCDFCILILEALARSAPIDGSWSAFAGGERDASTAPPVSLYLPECVNSWMEVRLGDKYGSKSSNQNHRTSILFKKGPEQACPEGLNTKLLPASHDSSDTFEYIKQDIQTCLRCHNDTCPKNVNVKLPTFLLDVSPANGEVRLIETDSATRGSYLVLSYCWGGTQEFQLTTETIDDFKTGILLYDLPKTLQDAIVVTRRLDMQYLWVDALCIIQDGGASKQQEIAQMARIYKISFLTIQAAISSSAQTGFLDFRERSRVPPVELSFSKNNGVETYVWAVLKDTFTPDDDTSWSTSKRSWIFQESIMPIRLLAYGRHQAYMSCRAESTSEDGSKSRSFVHIEDHLCPLELSRLRFQLLQSEFATLSAWYSCITMHYSGRTQQVGDDRLNALGALAEEVHQTIGGEYLAGIWSADLINGLKWQRSSRSQDFACPSPPEYLKKASRYRAPSWSWAAYDGPISFHYDAYPDVLESFCHIIVSQDSLPGLEILGAWTTKASNYPYGACRDGALVIKTLVGDATVRRTADGRLVHDTSSARMRFLGRQTEGWHPLFRLDDPDDVETDMCKAVFDTDDVVPMIVSCAFLTEWTGLMLVEVQGEEGERRFQRIGFFEVDDDAGIFCYDLERFLAWRQSFEFERIFII